MPRSTPGNYVPLDVNYPHDAAIRRAGEAAELLYIRGLAYAKRTKTNGFIPDYDLEVVAVGLRKVPPRVAALVGEGLWLVVEGGWRIRSWETWNSGHNAQSAAGSKAAHVRHHEKEGKRSEDCEWCNPHPPDDAIAHATGDAIALQSEMQGKGREVVNSPRSSKSSSVTREHDDDLDRIHAALAGLRPRQNISREWAVRAYRDITERMPDDVRNPLAYVLKAIETEPDRYLPVPIPAPFRAAPNPSGPPASDLAAAADAARDAVRAHARQQREEATA